MSTCRFCNNTVPGRFGEPIQYAVRHYAHAECGLAAMGEKFFDKLPLWQLHNFPFFAAKDAGLLPALEQRIDAANDPGRRLQDIVLAASGLPKVNGASNR